MDSTDTPQSVNKTCPSCGMVLLPSGCFETDYNRKGFSKPLTSVQAFTRVCQFHDASSPNCVNTKATGNLEPPPEPTTESWLPHVANLHKD